MTNEQIARVAHEANRAYCETMGDYSQLPWLQAEEWQRDSALAGVEFALAHPDLPASAQHEAWLKDKQTAGWIYGPVKDAAFKRHPCMVAYEDLPVEQRLKDALFKGVVNALGSQAQNTQKDTKNNV